RFPNGLLALRFWLCGGAFRAGHVLSDGIHRRLRARVRRDQGVREPMSAAANQSGPYSHVEAVAPPKSWRPSMSLRRQQRFYDVLAAVVVIVVVCFAIGPIVWTVLTSFKTEDQIVSRNFTWLPKTLTIDNYTTLWERSGYPRLLRNSAIVTGMTVLMSVT